MPIARLVAGRSGGAPCNGHVAPLCLPRAGHASGENNGFTRRTQRHAERPARPEQSRRANQRRNVADDHGDPKELLAALKASETTVSALRDQLKAILTEALER